VRVKWGNSYQGVVRKELALGSGLYLDKQGLKQAVVEWKRCFKKTRLQVKVGSSSSDPGPRRDGERQGRSERVYRQRNQSQSSGNNGATE